jgi:hypothetical protein
LDLLVCVVSVFDPKHGPALSVVLDDIPVSHG